VDDKQCYALPESGVVREGDKSFIFVADEDNDHGETEWVFKPIEVVEGEKDDGWIEIKPLESIENVLHVAWNNAYYLLAEMKKGEAEHEH
jgi:cobalt-zinc-cadmium efflux system membrane fusion protein